IIGSKSILVNGSLDKKPIFRVNTENKQIALTFDVNWAENEYIYDILDVLNKYNVKATFFVMGKWVNYPEGNKEKLIKINEMGHEIGNHSYVHPSFSKIDESRMLEELTKTDDIIYEAIGVKPTLFRFPSGDYNDKALQFVLEKGYKCIQWDCDSVDWKESGEEVEYERIMKKVTSGSIMLFHNNAKYTPSNLDKIISKLKEDGYEFVTVGQLTECDEYYIDENGEQHKK
ncbi:polysaccharide deacetylase family protein, partial [Clostridium saudiense]|nr:polysaccharide deacetylase family protein [Clostridium saudiense]